MLKNPLKIQLLMTNVTLVWEFTSGSSFSTSNEATSPEASCEVLETVLLRPEEERRVSMHEHLDSL